MVAPEREETLPLIKNHRLHHEGNRGASSELFRQQGTGAQEQAFSGNQVSEEHTGGSVDLAELTIVCTAVHGSR